MDKAYDPLDWHWRVGEDHAQLYSSAERQFIPVTLSDWPRTWYTTIDTMDSLRDVLSAAGAPAPIADIDLIKADLCARVDVDAERERCKYITAGGGQALEYQQTEMEADAYLGEHQADPNYAPGPLTYPMLEASVGIDGSDLLAVATTVLDRRASWLVIGAAIRGARLQAKETIRTAQTAAAAEAAYAAVAWPAPQGA